MLCVPNSPFLLIPLILRAVTEYAFDHHGCLPLASADPQKLCALARPPAVGGAGITSPVAGAAAIAASTAAARPSGPDAVGLVVSCVARVACGASHRQAR